MLRLIKKKLQNIKKNIIKFIDKNQRLKKESKNTTNFMEKLDGY